MKNIGFAAITISIALVCCLAQAQNGLAERAARIHEEAIVIDTHSDTTPKFENPQWDFSRRHESGHMDIPRMRDGGMDAQFYSIYMGKTEGDGKAIKTALLRIDAVHQMVRNHADDFVFATTAEGIRAAAAQGKMAALMGLEGGHIIENELGALRMFHELGIRYMTLTHSFNTAWADSAGTGMPVEPEHNGLTDYGRDVVREMNRLGMMVDISHVSDETFWDVLDVSEAPVFASHSSCRALADHARNMSNKMIKAMAEKGGVVQINFYPGYIDPEKVEQGKDIRDELREIEKMFADDPEKAREERRNLFARILRRPTPASVVIDHIEHVIQLVGPDHVGLGSDFDGVPQLPEGLDDCSKLPYVTEELLRRGHDEETIKKVLGGNMLRLMEEVEACSARLNAGGN